MHLFKRRSKEYELIAKSEYFDKRWYLKTYPDVAAAKMDPVQHYLQYGWKEGRDPSPKFNTLEYLNANPSVKSLNINPLIHIKQNKKQHKRKDIEFVSGDYSSKKYENIKDGFLDTNTIKNIIKSKNIKVVSFDIFDTLLLRPCINPTDIFYLIHKKLEDKYGIDFIKYRLNAEQLLGNHNASLEDIYKFIKQKYNLSQRIVNIMKTEELRCEKQLLSVRQDIFDVYQYALKQGKKVIAVSDMYLPSEFLKAVLHDKGYKDIQKVYVSNEYKQRKDDGTLYNLVIQKEKTQSIVHIGDNYNSDYINSIKAGLTGVYYPSVKDILFKNNKIYKDAFVFHSVSPDAFCRILMGYTFARHFNDINKIPNSKSVFNDIKDLADLAIAPLLFYIGLNIATSKDIQENYNQVLFASRDGYMPKKSYDIIGKYIKDLIPSKYVYSGRRAYFSAITDSLIDYIQNKVEIDGGIYYPLKLIIDTYIIDKQTKELIYSKLTKTELNLDFSTQKEECINILTKLSDILSDYFAEHKRNVSQYYNNIVSDASRDIIFDCGYSGSVSDAITKITNKPIDKIYLWQTDKNVQKDAENNTKTFVLMNNEKIFPTQHLVYEELFSPLEGGCLGFDNGIPILESVKFDNKMCEEMEEFQNSVEKYINDICDYFGDYVQYIVVKDTFALQSLLGFAFVKSPFCELSLLDNIKYPDKAFLSDVHSLTYKVQKHIRSINTFCGTGFNNPNNVIKYVTSRPNTTNKLGIHIHLYHPDLYNEFLYYLKDFPEKFDLFITYCGNHKNIISNVFNQNTCKNLNEVFVIKTKNRGRDVAPWLVSTKKYQDKYDLFCHVHTKNTNHLPFGQQWRRYLLKNLMQKDIVWDIINIFNNDESVGCVFPEIFAPLKQFCINLNIDQQGEFNERVIIQDLLSKMGFDHTYVKSDLFFSEGTMLWYRPKALKRLFDLNLTYNSFPPEPIGVGGTIAHAIERLPALVCRLDEYKPVSYSRYK